MWLRDLQPPLPPDSSAARPNQSWLLWFATGIKLSRNSSHEFRQPRIFSNSNCGGSLSPWSKKVEGTYKETLSRSARICPPVSDPRTFLSKVIRKQFLRHRCSSPDVARISYKERAAWASLLRRPSRRDYSCHRNQFTSQYSWGSKIVVAAR